MEQHVIIVAGGKGLRMGTEIPKQFLELNGKAIIIHTLEKFKQALPQARLVLVLPDNEIARWKALAKNTEFESLEIVAGGETRFQSVKAGLSLVPNGVIVGIHDAVRPLVSANTINTCFAEAEKSGAAIPILEIKDSIRKVVGNSSIPVDRSAHRLVQTPQCFRSELLHKAYQQDFNTQYTDDASVLESLGESISLVQGNPENIKITEPVDLKWAEIILES